MIGAILLRKQPNALEIDLGHVSCRVLQRGVVQFERNDLVGGAEDGVRLFETFIPTSKNVPVVELYERLGFSPIGANGGRTFWELKMRDDLPPVHQFIRRETAHG